MNLEIIRNFCIIAHIDHGKSTLADRLLEITQTLSAKQMQSQVLDDMDLERERGITIKSHPIQMQYNHTDNISYKLNLIDTPGHVDFAYEVSRSLAACEGALLLVDASQGVEAQTVSNAYLAANANLSIIPVINKIDAPGADPESAINQMIDLLGCEREEIIQISAKKGTGVKNILNAIIHRIPCPVTTSHKGTRALIFDSTFDQFRGVVPYVRIVDGYLERGMTTQYFAKPGTHEITEVGVLQMDKIPVKRLEAGDVGYVVTNIKNVSEVSVGDTLTVKSNLAESPLPGYQPVKPMVFSGMYPIDSKDYEDLRTSLEKLQLNDAAISFEPNTSTALGFGFRCGFLGPLHMEIVQERLEREFDMNLITTSPNVSYQVNMKNGDHIQIDNPTELPSASDIDCIFEPYIKAEIIAPSEHIGGIMKLCMSKRGVYRSTNYLSQEKVQLIFDMPLGEIIYDFFEKLKSTSRGFASFDYEITEDKSGDLVKLDVRIAGEVVDALSIIVHRDNAFRQGSILCKKLKKEIHRQQFEIPIQASIGSKIISRETVKAFRKNVTAKCYGGDITRKRKLLEKQKSGKKRMKQVGIVELPQEAFLAVLKMDND
ncbi:MAG: translation elongation factor 4 [Candidatus Marinimicrobia bacterium]|nr:translation elongation factor 4 [Candidatus Neomarinimicrobiota bacterium]MDP6852422.1 translation elongation factor 4 [Candidatus Neomarinimicrobiota bacterium]